MLGAKSQMLSRESLEHMALVAETNAYFVFYNKTTRLNHSKPRSIGFMLLVFLHADPQKICLNRAACMSKLLLVMAKCFYKKRYLATARNYINE
jgi:hypothetical protein